MRKILIFLIIAILFGCGSEKFRKPSKEVECMAFPFKLNDVELLASPFKKAMELDAEWLINLNPDRLLYRYRVSAGLAAKDSSYGGWEVRFSGHTLGHYLSACAMMYASTGDKNMKKRVDYVIQELEICQNANGNGYAGGVRYGGRIFDEIKNGDIRLEYNGFKLNDCWVPWYNIHKILAGLIDAYKYTGSNKAYQILLKMTDWVDSVVSGLTDQQVQEMLQSEHGGINESLATVYILTGEKKYLDLAKRFNHREIMDPLYLRMDKLDGKHANSQIPKIIGALKQFEAGGDSSFFKIADFFWNTVINHHSYVIGGNAESEYFGPPDHLHDRITDFTCENCGTYNMLKLTAELFCLNPSVEKVDYYERALYNQILASQNHSNGTVTYFSGMDAGSARQYCSPDESFWCCTGTGFENHAKYGEAIYYHDGEDELYVNLFIPSILDWKEQNVRLTQQTKYPFSDQTVIKLNMKHSREFKVKLRYPFWAKNGVAVTINGEPYAVSSEPGSYIDITRKWQDGDIINYHMSMSLSSEQIPGNSSKKAYLYGPVVLAADLGYGIYDKPFPVIIQENKDSKEHIKLIDFGSLTFTLEAYPEDVNLVPYMFTGEKSTVVYFSHFTPLEWEKAKGAFLPNRFGSKQIQSHSTDVIDLGKNPEESDHNMSEHNSVTGTYKGLKFREAQNGWFSYRMKVSNQEGMGLLCTIRGDQGNTQNLDIYIDDEFLINVDVNNWGNGLITKYYNMPLDYTLGKDEVTVTFRSNEKQTTGPVFDCRMVRQLKSCRRMPF